MKNGKKEKEKEKGKKHYAEDTRDLLRFALDQKPNAFKEKFEELMLSKIVDLSDEMKDELAQSMFGESSHEYGKKKKKSEMKEAKKEKEEEDEDEYEADVEDEDFDLSDEDLDDLDLDDLDFEDEEDEISESEMKRALGDISYGDLSPEELAKMRANRAAFDQKRLKQGKESYTAQTERIKAAFIRGANELEAKRQK